MQEQGSETAEVKQRVTADVANVKQAFSQRLRDALTKPVTLVIACLVFILTIGAEYLFSRIMDAIWEVDPPEEVVKLNSELHLASDELKKASRDIESLVGRINQSKIEDPQLREQLSGLDEKLFSLNELVVKTSAQTDKMATISEALREDWVRLKERAGQDIDTLPDIVLAVGEGAQLCNGLTPIGVTRIGNNWATVNLGGDSQTMYSGARRAIGDDAWIDLIGPKNRKGLFKIHCSNA